MTTRDQFIEDLRDGDAKRPACQNFHPFPAQADHLISLGYARVSDDTDTVERVAKAMANADGYDAWTSMPAGKRDRHLIQARAAIAALKGENQ